jgi:hypothetical protein
MLHVSEISIKPKYEAWSQQILRAQVSETCISFTEKYVEESLRAKVLMIIKYNNICLNTWCCVQYLVDTQILKNKS